MSTNLRSTKVKQRVVHELVEFAALFLYLAFFFCALSTYSMLLLSEFHVRYLSYAFALLNALVIAKVIMIGELAGFGRRHEHRSLLVSSAYKAVIFGVLVLAFHMAEEAIKHRLHGVKLTDAVHQIRGDELLGRILIVFCTFVPLFAFREFRRILGADRFNTMVFRSAAKPPASSKD
jgi:hypothetical protein